MCCIIHRPKSAKAISDSRLKAIIRINCHGWGIAYFKDGILQIVKSLEMNDAIKRVRDLEEEDIEFLFHARYATHGEKIIENCHPFELMNGVLFHNGKIDIRCKNKKLSDTHYFTQRVNKFLRKHRSFDWIVNKFKSNLGQSRLAIMDNKGKITKFGEWHEVDGCFFSKLTWQWNYDYDCDGYWESYGNYNPSKATWNNVNRVMSPYETILDNIKRGLPSSMRTYLLNACSEKELVMLAVNHPVVCAEYIKKNF